MTVSVQQPQAKNPLDDVVKGLQIANSLFGIKSNMDRAEQLRVETAQKIETEGAKTAESARRFDVGQENVERGFGLKSQQIEATAANTAARQEVASQQRQFSNDFKLTQQAFRVEQEEGRRNKIKNEAIRKLTGEYTKAGVPDALSALKQLDKSIGSMDSTDDIPGIGLGAAKPNFALSDEGKRVRLSLAAVRNKLLSVRSGSAVTDQELARLSEELGGGVGMTDDDLRFALKQVRDKLKATVQNFETGVDPDILQAFISDRPNAISSKDPFFGEPESPQQGLVDDPGLTPSLRDMATELLKARQAGSTAGQ